MVTAFAQGTVLRALATAPAIPIESLTGTGGVLVLAPHPDDETLGCGKAIASATRSGRSVVVVALTDGRLSHPKSRLWPADALIRLRADEMREAVSILSGGRAVVHMLGYPDQGPEMSAMAFRRMVDRLVALCDTHAITALWTAWAGDPHGDHKRAAAIATAVAARRPHLRTAFFPVWGRFIETGPGADEAVRIFDDAGLTALKRAALAAHRSQMTNLIHDDPDGFVMEEEVQRHFVETPEIFLMPKRAENALPERADAGADA